MQKKLIALAVAGLLSAPAFAQVTVYGIVDAGLASFDGKSRLGGSGATANDKDVRVTGVEAGPGPGSRLGFRGTEDLGNGLSAFFVLEQAIGNDTTANAAGMFSSLNRESVVGLTSTTAGTVQIGRMRGAGWYFAGKFSPQGGYAAVSDFIGGVANTKATIEDSHRVDNAIAYVSPTVAGLSARVIYSFMSEADGESAGAAPTPDTEEKDAQINALVDYTNGPIGAAAVYNRINNFSKSNAAGKTGDVGEWGLGGSYDLTVAKLMASYQRRTADRNAFSDYTDKTWTVGARIPTTATGAVALGYGRLTGDELVAGAKNEASSWSVGYTHGLSKRTVLYAAYARLSTKEGYVGANGTAANGTTGNPFLTSAATATIGFGDKINIIGGENYNRMTVGLYHTF